MKHDDWQSALEAGLRSGTAPLAVGYSGGLDSTVLLHRLAASPQAQRRGLRALHVDHGLQPASADWPQHCAAACAALDLPFEARQVEVERRGSVEANARRARYAALAAMLHPGETLVLAQHRNDQAETVLLQLLRGAGIGALGAMRRERMLGANPVWRPLLDVARGELERYATQHALSYIDDPSNADLRLSRNAIRHRVLPLLREHWPQAEASLAASARLLAEDAELIDGLAERALLDCHHLDPSLLRIEPLQALPAALQRHVLRRWIEQAGLSPPPPTVLARVAGELIAARADATPSLHWRGGRLRRYRELLHCTAPASPPAAFKPIRWDGSDDCELPPPFGRLQLLPAPHPLLPMRVATRIGGETIALPGRPRRPLRHVLQELGIPPWERERLPLLFAADDGELLGAGDLVLGRRLLDLLDAAERTLRWWPADAAAAGGRD